MHGCEARVSSRALLAPLHTRCWAAGIVAQGKISTWGILVAHKAHLARQSLQRESHRALLANQGRLLVSMCVFINQALQKAHDTQLSLFLKPCSCYMKAMLLLHESHDVVTCSLLRCSLAKCSQIVRPEVIDCIIHGDMSMLSRYLNAGTDPNMCDQ